MEEEKAKAAEKRANKNPLDSTDEEDPEQFIQRQSLTELDRLHYHILSIENECHICPQGAFKLNHYHEVQRNEAFNGLKADEIDKLTSYSHFRPV